MKKIDDQADITKLQSVFQNIDGAKFGSSLVQFERESYYQKTADQEPDFRLFNKSYGDILYGKLDNKDKVIVPNSEFIASMNYVKGGHSSLIFVSDAYRELVKEWNKISGEEKRTIDIIPQLAYENFETYYKEYITENILIFFIYLQSNNLLKNIHNLPSFLKEISKIISIDTKMNPFTITKFIESKNCPDNITGLSIVLPHDDDSYKTKRKFLTDPLFSDFKESAKRYGFIIDKNNPWKIYFNLESYYAKNAVKKYLSENESFEKHFYKKFFITTSEYDLFFIKKYIIEIYNSIVGLSPRSTEKQISKCKDNFKIKVKKINRTEISSYRTTQILNQDADIHWWRFFIFVRLCEAQAEVNQSQFEELVKESYSIYVNIDNATANAYASERVSQLPRSENRERNFSY